MKTIKAWPVSVYADCEGKTRKVLAWFDSEAAASRFAHSGACRASHDADHSGPGFIGEPITIQITPAEDGGEESKCP